MDHLEWKLNIDINKANDRIMANKLTFNAKKSNLLVINPKLNSPPTETNSAVLDPLNLSTKLNTLVYTLTTS